MQSLVLKPNILKSYLLSIAKVLAAIAVIVLLLLFFDWFVGFETFVEVFELLGIIINPKEVFVYFLFAIGSITVFLLVLNYIMLSSVRYEFQNDKLRLVTTQFLILLKKEEIKYINITQANFNASIIDQILNSGTITLSLRGMTSPTKNLELIDSASYFVNYINRILDIYRLVVQNEINKKLKVKNLLRQQDSIYQQMPQDGQQSQQNTVQQK